MADNLDSKNSTVPISSIITRSKMKTQPQPPPPPTDPNASIVPTVIESVPQTNDIPPPPPEPQDVIVQKSDILDDKTEFKSDEEETEVTDDYTEHDTEESDEEESDEEESDEDDDQKFKTRVVLVINGGQLGMRKNNDDSSESEEDLPPSCCANPEKKRRGNNNETLPEHFTKQERAYFRKLPKTEQTEVLALDKQIKDRTDIIEKVPLKFRILQSDAEAATKHMVLKKIDQLQKMHQGSGEYSKLRNWLDGVSRLPLGKYHKLPVSPTDPTQMIANYLQDVRKSLDNTVYGHHETKDEIMKTFARWVSNPDSKGLCIGLQGAAGTGKTSLIHQGICKALGFPFAFVALGGASDGAFLEGHSVTYEGSIYGKIAEVIMKAQVMNPIMYFDELDKVSQSRRGEEVTNILIHLTDTSQNDRFTDRYFSEIELNLSKSLIVFSYNDESLINPILKDRMITIHVKGYNKKEKLEIAKGYLLPGIFEQFNIPSKDVIFDDKTIEAIIEKVPSEEGVRNLKRGLESIMGWLNMHRFIPDPMTKELVQFPIKIEKEHLEKYLKTTDFANSIKQNVLHSMYM